MLEYKINDLLVLKLENGSTNIYIDGELFRQCKYLLLNFSRENAQEYSELLSMDDIIDKYSRVNERNKMIIEPKQEFIGHCSNLQAWYENDYSLDILHHSLSFPLLSILAKKGDKRAKIFLKEEILRRMERGDEKVVTYFLNEGYLWLFSHEELELIFDVVDIERQDTLRRINRLMNRKWLIEKSEKRKHQIILIQK